MLRNILANPLIRYIVLTGDSVTDSYDALNKFFALGVDQEWKIIENGGHIDPSFPQNVLKVPQIRGWLNVLERVPEQIRPRLIDTVDDILQSGIV